MNHKELTGFRAAPVLPYMESVRFSCLDGCSNYPCFTLAELMRQEQAAIIPDLDILDGFAELSIGETFETADGLQWVRVS